jgi:hypothetical protein
VISPTSYCARKEGRRHGVDEFRERLCDADPDVRAYFIGKLMRQAKPDDVFTFVSLATIREHWDRLSRHLGRQRDFWTWLLATWERQARAHR